MLPLGRDSCPSQDRLHVAPPGSEDLFGSANAAVLRLLEKRYPGKIAVREVNPSVRLGGANPIAAEHEPWIRANHGVSPAKNVDAFDRVAKANVRPLEVGHHQI